MEELCELINREKVYAIRGCASIIGNFVNYVIAHPVTFPLHENYHIRKRNFAG